MERAGDEFVDQKKKVRLKVESSATPTVAIDCFDMLLTEALAFFSAFTVQCYPVRNEGRSNVSNVCNDRGCQYTSIINYREVYQ